VLVSRAMRKLLRLATRLKGMGIRRVVLPARLGPGLMVLLSLLFSGPQGTLVLSAMAACPPLKCMSRDCCCGTNRDGSAACRMGPARCDPAAPFVLTTAKGILPPEDGALLAFDASGPVDAVAPARTTDGHDRRLEPPPRSSF
jgi:hypothetical protein